VRVLRALTNPAPPLASVIPTVSPAVAHVVDHALQQEKEKRFADAHRMQERVRAVYHDRFKVPIGTAPRLTVPEEVPNRSHILQARAPTTGQPVTGASSLGMAQPSRIAVLVVGGVVGVGVASIVVAVRRHAREGVGEPSTTAGQHASTFTMTPRTPSESVSALSTAVDQPSTRRTATRAPCATTAPPIVASTARAPSKANCNPPFVIDPGTGKKTWKVECL
jgi:serine/threonine-protein kinase